MKHVLLLLTFIEALFISACGGGGASFPRDFASAAPAGVTAAISDSQIQISWADVPGASSYNVYYSTNSGVTIANGKMVAGATSGSAISGLVRWTPYFFVVTAVNAGGESAASNKVSATPAPSGVWTTKTPMLHQRDNAANVVLNGKIYVFAGAPAGVSVLSSMEVYDPATDTWPVNNPATSTPWASMPAPRYGPAAVANNGLIYVMGGTSIVNGQSPIYPMTVYNPASNSWSSTVPTNAATTTTGTAGQALAPIPTGRWGFEVAVVDGLMYAIGGGVHVPGGVSKAGWVKGLAKQVPNASSGAAVTGLNNDVTYYFIVTAVDATSGVESVASFGVASTPQATYAARVVPAGLGIAAGNGQAALSWTAATGATSYNVYYGTQSSVTTSSLTKLTGIGKTSTNVTGLTNNTAYYFVVTAITGGGETAVSNEVAATPQVTPDASVPSSVSVTGGDMQATLSWTPVANAASYNVYYGTGINLYFGNTEVYDPVANTWMTKTLMPTPRWGSTVSAVNGNIYAIGGWGGWPDLSLIEVYDPTTDIWSATVPVNAATTTIGTAGAPLAPMPTARDDFGFSVVNGIIYVIGGDTNIFDNATSTPCCTKAVEAYDPVANTWSTKSPMPTMRDDFDASAVDGMIYAIAGSRDGTFATPGLPNDGGYSLTTVEAFSMSNVPAPNGVAAVIGTNQVSLSWNVVADATAYNIYWSNKAGVSTTANSTKITNGTLTAYSHTGLTTGAWYYYIVTTVTASGESPPSNEVAVKR